MSTSVHFPPDKRPLSRIKIILILLWRCESPEQSSKEHGNPLTCTLHDIRVSNGFRETTVVGSYEQWYEWVKSLTDAEAEVFHKEYEKCVNCPMKLTKLIYDKPQE